MINPENHGKHISALYVIAGLLALIAATLAYGVWYEHAHSLGL
jgi:hypothetical protein